MMTRAWKEGGKKEERKRKNEREGEMMMKRKGNEGKVFG